MTGGSSASGAGQPQRASGPKLEVISERLRVVVSANGRCLAEVAGLVSSRLGDTWTTWIHVVNGNADYMHTWIP